MTFINAQKVERYFRLLILTNHQLSEKHSYRSFSHRNESIFLPIYGARPLRRFLQHTVETLVSKKIIADQVEPGSRITVDCRDGELTVDTKEVLTGEVIDG